MLVNFPGQSKTDYFDNDLLTKIRKINPLEFNSPSINVVISPNDTNINNTKNNSINNQNINPLNNPSIVIPTVGPSNNTTI